LPLRSYPMVMTHDSASGYFGECAWYDVLCPFLRLVSKTQSSGLVGQMNAGARAFDLRVDCTGPRIEDIRFHHGQVKFHKKLVDLIEEVKYFAFYDRNLDLYVLYISSVRGPNCINLVDEALKAKGITRGLLNWRYSILDRSVADIKANLTDGGAHIIAVSGGATMAENYEKIFCCDTKNFADYMSNTVLKAAAAAEGENGFMQMVQAHWQIPKSFFDILRIAGWGGIRGITLDFNIARQAVEFLKGGAVRWIHSSKWRYYYKVVLQFDYLEESGVVDELWTLVHLLRGVTPPRPQVEYFERG